MVILGIASFYHFAKPDDFVFIYNTGYPLLHQVGITFLPEYEVVNTCFNVGKASLAPSFHGFWFYLFDFFDFDDSRILGWYGHIIVCECWNI